jgi:NTE family protein
MKVRATDFDIDRATQDQLYENGRKAATDFLANAAGQIGTEGGAEAPP